MEKNEEHARFHMSPGPSYRPSPLQNSPDGYASGGGQSDAEAIDCEPAEALRRAVLDPDEVFDDERTPETGRWA
eukprot:1489339-Pyramimonas_sp.AAC.1